MAVVKNMIVRVGADMSGLISGFKKGSGATGSFAKEAAAAMRSATLSQANLSKAMAQGGKNKAIVSLVDQIRELEEEQKALKAAGFSWGYEGFESNEALLRSLKAELQDYIRTQEQADDATEQTSRKMGRFGTAVKSVRSWLKQGAKNILSIGSSAKASGPGVEGLLRSIRRLGIVSLGLRFTRAIFGELGTIVHQHISEHAALQAQVNGLKSAFGQALAPAINIVTNALAALMPYVVGVSNAIGSLIGNMFGSGWTTVADGANAAAKAIGGAGGAQKEFNRSLQGFDEITKLDNKSSGGGGGGGGSADSITSIEGKLPVWLEELIPNIQQAVQEENWKGVGAAIAESLNEGIDSFSDMDVSVGSRIAGWINSGIDVADGLIRGANWEKLGGTIGTNVKDLFNGIDWDTVLTGAGSLAGSVTNWLVSGVSGFAGYFKGYIEEARATYPEIGEDIGLGIIMGICDAFVSAADWIGENLWTPLKDGFLEAFDGTGWAKLFGGNDVAGKTKVDVEANVTEINDEVRNRDLDRFSATIRNYYDDIGNKTLQNGTVVFTSAKDNIKHKIVGGGTLELIQKSDKIKDKYIKGGAMEVASVKDNATNKVFGGGTLQMATVEDKTKSKVFGGGTLQMATVEDKTKSKVFGGGTLQMAAVEDKAKSKTFEGGKLWINSVVDKTQSKTFGGGTLQMATVEDKTKSKVFGGGTLQMAAVEDKTKSKVFGGGTLQMATVEDKTKSKVFGGGTLQMATVEDKTKSKVFGGGTLQMATVEDKTKSKVFGGGTLQMATVEDKTKSKVFSGGTLWINSVVDKTQSKTFGGGTLQMAAVEDKAKSKVFSGGTLKMFSLTDEIESKTIGGGLLKVTSWTDNIGADNKKLSLKANVTKGWKGTLEDALGISSLTTKLYVKTPDIDVTWSNSKAPGGVGSVASPEFTVRYNAMGAIFSSASLLGRVGNDWQVAGEAGREALLPLDRHTWWMDDIADRVVSRISGGGAGGEQNITVNLVADGKTLATTVVRHINAQARATGRNPLAAYI